MNPQRTNSFGLFSEKKQKQKQKKQTKLNLLFWIQNYIAVVRSGSVESFHKKGDQCMFFDVSKMIIM